MLIDQIPARNNKQGFLGCGGRRSHFIIITIIIIIIIIVIFNFYSFILFLLLLFKYIRNWLSGITMPKHNRS